VHGATIENIVGHISCFALRARAFRGVPNEAYGDAEAIGRFVDEGSGKRRSVRKNWRSTPLTIPKSRTAPSPSRRRHLL